MSTPILVGLGLAAVGVAGRAILKYAPEITKGVEQTMANLSKPTFSALSGSHFYKGGFEKKMTKREAALILGVSPNAQKLKIKEAHKKIMLINHPDRGGSPYIASKINEAKDIMDAKKPF